MRNKDNNAYHHTCELLEVIYKASLDKTADLDIEL